MKQSFKDIIICRGIGVRFMIYDHFRYSRTDQIIINQRPDHILFLGLHSRMPGVLRCLLIASLLGFCCSNSYAESNLSRSKLWVSKTANVEASIEVFKELPYDSRLDNSFTIHGEAAKASLRHGPGGWVYTYDRSLLTASSSGLESLIQVIDDKGAFVQITISWEPINPKYSLVEYMERDIQLKKFFGTAKPKTYETSPDQSFGPEVFDNFVKHSSVYRGLTRVGYTANVKLHHSFRGAKKSRESFQQHTFVDTNVRRYTIVHNVPKIVPSNTFDRLQKELSIFHSTLSFAPQNQVEILQMLIK